MRKNLAPILHNGAFLPFFCDARHIKCASFLARSAAAWAFHAQRRRNVNVKRKPTHRRKVVREPHNGDTLKCCLCGHKIQHRHGWTLGNNADPLSSGHGRCCDECNALHVIPARLAMMLLAGAAIRTRTTH